MVTKQNIQKETILIAEDYSGVRHAIHMILRPFYTVYTADDGEKVLQLIEEKEIDLITLDFRLPKIQGLDLLNEIRKRRPNVEVVFITGDGAFKTSVDRMAVSA